MVTLRGKKHEEIERKEVVMAPEEEENQITYAVEADDGIVLRAHPLALYQEWARRYGAALRPYTGYRYEQVGEGLRPVPFPCEVFWVSDQHEHALDARIQARNIYRMHRINEYNVAVYYYFRQQLQEAHYSQEQLDSLPQPEQVEVLHVNGKCSPCLGVIHRARLEGDVRPCFFCERCTWVRPVELRGRREELHDEGVLLMPVDPMLQLPFFTGPSPWQWSRRVLLRQGKLMEVREAALLLDVKEEILASVCRAGGFQWFQHPDDPNGCLLYRREVQAYHERQRQKQAAQPEPSDTTGSL